MDRDSVLSLQIPGGSLSQAPSAGGARSPSSIPLQQEWLDLLRRVPANPSHVGKLDAWCRKNAVFPPEIVGEALAVMANATVHQRVNVLYAIDALCMSCLRAFTAAKQAAAAANDASARRGEPREARKRFRPRQDPFLDAALRDMLALMHTVAPLDDPLGYMNLWNLESVVARWRGASLFPTQALDAIEQHLDALGREHKRCDAVAGPQLQRLERIRARQRQFAAAELQQHTAAASSAAAAARLPAKTGSPTASAGAESAPDSPAASPTAALPTGANPILPFPPFTSDMSNRLEAERDRSKRTRESSWARPPGDTDAAEFSRVFEALSQIPFDPAELAELLADASERSGRGESRDLTVLRGSSSDAKRVERLVELSTRSFSRGNSRRRLG